MMETRIDRLERIVLSLVETADALVPLLDNLAPEAARRLAEIRAESEVRDRQVTHATAILEEQRIARALDRARTPL